MKYKATRTIGYISSRRLVSPRLALSPYSIGINAGEFNAAAELPPLLKISVNLC